MSWQLGAFAILGFGLVGGFAWYERSRPDARVIALVATLAALAVIGRIAFAALPNVKPSTDIVLIAGYTLGGAPGFVVGAVTGLVSNFFFGQGPWTVWQMAAWAATGLFGGGLAVLTRGRIRRWPLALVCLAVGLVFAALQDVGDWVTYSDHSSAQLAVYVGKGIGFDCIHAIGCLVFALAFGPALLRALRRFTARLTIRWLPVERFGLPVLLVGALGVSAAGLGLGAPTALAGGSPAGYLLSAQNADGGFGSGPGAGSSPLYAGWAALGLAAEGINPADVHRGGASLLDYVAATTPSDVGSVERTILVARAAGANAAAFAGRDLPAELESHIGRDGSIGEQVNLTAFGILALRAAGAAVPGRTLGWLARQQNGDGGYGFGRSGGASDDDDTGAVLEAVAGTSAGSTTLIHRAVAFIRAAQNGDGGLPSQPPGPSDTQSTAWVLQGLVAVGLDPGALPHGSPARYLQALIAPDGHVRYAAGNDQTPVWVTGEAAMALAGRALPLPPVPRASAPAAGSTPGSTPHTRASPRAARSSSLPSAAATHAARHAASSHRAAATAKSTSPILETVVSEDESAIVGALARVLQPIGVAVQQPYASVNR